MSRDSGRDERDKFREQDRLGGMVLSLGRSGGSLSSGSEDTEQAIGRLNGDAKRGASQLREYPAGLGVNGRASRSRDVLLVRNHAYSVSPAERALLTDVGKFRTVAVSDCRRRQSQLVSGRAARSPEEPKGRRLPRAQCHPARRAGRTRALDRARREHRVADALSPISA